MQNRIYGDVTMSYYMSIAKAVAQKSSCLRKKRGAVIINKGSIVSTGYNGPARGTEHCSTCARDTAGSRKGYEVCSAVHAEQNAIINAARNAVCTVESTMYTTGLPCIHCARMIINAGITEVVYIIGVDLESVALLQSAGITVTQESEEQGDGF